jgi:hypothetical protein
MAERQNDDNAAGDADESGPANRAGRFSLSHRGGTRVEVSDPILLPASAGKDRPWLCAVKLLGPKKSDDEEVDLGVTQTLLVRTGRGNTPEEAQRDAMAQLSLMYGTPTAPPPSVVITRMPSLPPPTPERSQPANTLWAWLTRFFGKSK